MVDHYTFMQNVTDTPTDGRNIWNVGHGGDFTFYVESSRSAMANQQVVFETAVDPHFLGAWAVIGTVALPQTGVAIVQLEGALCCVRARIEGGPLSTLVTVTGVVEY